MTEEKKTENAVKTMIHAGSDANSGRPVTDPAEISKLWDETFSPENLKLLFNSKVKCRKNGTPKKSVGLDFVTVKKFEEDLDNNLDIIIRKVKNQSYHFTRYKLILALKGPGKAPRELRLPTVRDRVTLAAMGEFARRVLGAKCELPAGRKIISDIMKQRKNFTGYVKTDISSFFKSIPHDKLIDMMNRKFIHPGIVGLFVNSITTGALLHPQTSTFNPKQKKDTGIPEGLSYSSFVANAYLEDLDSVFENIPEIRYYRFVDDILILADRNNTGKYRKMVECSIAARGLSLSADKTTDDSENLDFDYLGYSFKGDTVSIRDSSVAKIQQSLAEAVKKIAIKLKTKLETYRKKYKGEELENIEKFVKSAALTELNQKITGFRMGGIYYSWMSYYRNINDYSLLGRLDAIVKKHLKKYGVDEYITPKKYIKTMNELVHNPETSYIPDFSCMKNFISDYVNSENSRKEPTEFEVSNTLVAEIAVSLGWTRESPESKNDYFEYALSLAAKARFEFSFSDGKILFDKNKFKRAVIKGLNKSIVEEKGM